MKRDPSEQKQANTIAEENGNTTQIFKKDLYSKSFDTEMCPLPFPVEKMYHFVLERFDGTTAAVQDQNLQWLQVCAQRLTVTSQQLSLEKKPDSMRVF